MRGSYVPVVPFQARAQIAHAPARFAVAAGAREALALHALLSAILLLALVAKSVMPRNV